MSLLDKLITEPLLIGRLDRIARAIEHQSSILEMLLPSPLTQPGFVDNDQKPKGLESFSIYSDKEAYYDERKRIAEEMQKEAFDDLDES